MRVSICGAAALLGLLQAAACSPVVVTSNVTVAAAPEPAARQPAPPAIAEAPSAPSSAAAPSIVIEGSALQAVDDAELARRAVETSKGLRGLASIGRRDEDAVRRGVQLTYAKSPDEVRAYILWQYSFSRVKVLDEERELTRRLGHHVRGSDALFEAPADEDALDGAADALEALARRLVADP